MGKNEKIFETIFHLFQEASLQKSDEEILDELEESLNASYNKNLTLIRRLNTKAKAKIQKDIADEATNSLKDLIGGLGSEQFFNQISLKNPSLQTQLFSKFESMTKEDEESMLTDSKFLDLVRDLRSNIHAEEDNT